MPEQEGVPVPAPGVIAPVDAKSPDACSTDAYPADYRHLLRDRLRVTDCQLRAPMMMDNPGHLLATLRESAWDGRLIQKRGRHCVGLINERRRRTGTLWDGRYRSSVIDSNDQLLCCSRYGTTHCHACTRPSMH